MPWPWEAELPKFSDESGNLSEDSAVLAAIVAPIQGMPGHIALARMMTAAAVLSLHVGIDDETAVAALTLALSELREENSKQGTH
jgi:hypothetical protein